MFNMIKPSILLLFLSSFKAFFVFRNGSPIPIQLQDEDKTARMKFHLQLPTNETVLIKLTFKLLTSSKPLPYYSFENYQINNATSNSSAFTTSTSTTTTSTPSIEEEETTLEYISKSDSSERTTLEASSSTVAFNLISSEAPAPFEASSTSIPPIAEPQLMTLGEAIENFRKNLIQKEMEIAGIIESDHPFYRHFRFEYMDGMVLPIRCTYDAKFKQQLLSIDCYEYREVGAQRILSNGEFETAALQYTPEYIDARVVKQSYAMTIV